MNLESLDVDSEGVDFALIGVFLCIISSPTLYLFGGERSSRNGWHDSPIHIHVRCLTMTRAGLVLPAITMLS
jgi:hypothetical protein